MSKMPDAAAISGGCACGSIRYSVDGPVLDFSHCHCTICRRLHGAGIVSFGGVSKKAFRWIAGEDLLTIYASSAKNNRYFCTCCGSQLLVISNKEPDMIYLAMGAMDAVPPLPPGYHQFCKSQVSWIELCDDLPRFAGQVEEQAAT